MKRYRRSVSLEVPYVPYLSIDHGPVGCTTGAPCPALPVDVQCVPCCSCVSNRNGPFPLPCIPDNTVPCDPGSLPQGLYHLCILSTTHFWVYYSLLGVRQRSEHLLWPSSCSGCQHTGLQVLGLLELDILSNLEKMSLKLQYLDFASCPFGGKYRSGQVQVRYLAVLGLPEIMAYI